MQSWKIMNIFSSFEADIPQENIIFQFYFPNTNFFCSLTPRLGEPFFPFVSIFKFYCDNKLTMSCPTNLFMAIISERRKCCTTTWDILYTRISERESNKEKSSLIFLHVNRFVSCYFRTFILLCHTIIVENLYMSVPNHPREYCRQFYKG